MIPSPHMYSLVSTYKGKHFRIMTVRNAINADILMCVCLESKINFPPATSMFLEVISDACDQTLHSLHNVIIISTGNLLMLALVGRLLLNNPVRFQLFLQEVFSCITNSSRCGRLCKLYL